MLRSRLRASHSVVAPLAALGAGISNGGGTNCPPLLVVSEDGSQVLAMHLKPDRVVDVDVLRLVCLEVKHDASAKDMCVLRCCTRAWA